MSSIHILVPTPSFPPTEEHNDDDEQAAPLALTWCCVYIVSILEKKTFSPSPSLSLPLSVCVSISLSPSPSLSKTPQTFSPLVPQVVSHPSRIHHRSRSNVCNVSLLFMLLFLCVLLVNENIRCSKTSERNGYLGKNEGEIKKNRKEKEERKRKRSRPVPSEWYGQSSSPLFQKLVICPVCGIFWSGSERPARLIHDNTWEASTVAGGDGTWYPPLRPASASHDMEDMNA